MDQTLINRIIEAALLASSQPLTVVQLGALFPLDEPAPEGSIQAALDALQADAAGRGIELVEVASGWRYQVQADVHAWVARLWTERQIKYTRATLETLALIAYRQPITRGEIEQVRGVATSSNIVKALEEREWIRVVGHRDMPGRPELLGTTKAFLDYFGLKRLDELPPLSELKDFGELEPQFEFEGGRGVGGIAGAEGGDLGPGTGDRDGGDLAANDEAAPDADDADDARDDVQADDSDAADTADTAAGDDASDEADDAVHPDTADDQTLDDPDNAADADTSAYDDGNVVDSDAADTDTDTDTDDVDIDVDDSTNPDHPQADGDDAAATQDALADDGDSTRSRHE